MSHVSADLRYAVRRWKARPALALTAIVTLALGIGTATAIFSVVDGVLLRPLPWRDPDRLVSVWIVRPPLRTIPVMSVTWNTLSVSWSEFRNLQQRSRTFDEIAIWTRTPPAILRGTNDFLQGIQVSSGFLPMLGVNPYAGRNFTVDEDDGASDSLILSYEAWQSRFGGRGDILGLRVVLEERPRTVVGVLPPRFRFEGDAAHFIIPFGASTPEQRSNNTYRAVARLKSGVTIADAAQDTEPILRGAQTPDRRTSRLEPLAETQLGQSREPMLLLLGASALLLLIACANVAGLLLGDARARMPELVLRHALGASRLRIARQLLAEHVLLAAGGGFIGIIAAWWITPALVAIAPEGLPRLATVSVDARVLSVALVTTCSPRSCSVAGRRSPSPGRTRPTPIATHAAPHGVPAAGPDRS